jgi:NitT/TauT family transport system substrate-binding protein
LTNVTVGVVPYSPDAIIWHAIESGMFKKHGLNVTTKKAASPIAVSAAMASGDQQFGFITTPVLINANLQGQGMKCVSSVAGGNDPNPPKLSNALVASKKSGITSLEGFAGKTIAQVQLGSINRLDTLIEFSQAGVKNVKQIAIPFPQMPQALASGRVAGAVIVVPFLQTALKNGARIITHPGAKEFPNATLSCFAATTDYLKDHAKVAKEFQATMREALLYAKDHLQEVLKTTLPKYMGLSPEAAAQQKVQTNWKPELNVASIGKVEQEMKKFGWIKKTVPAKTLVWSADS